MNRYFRWFLILIALDVIFMPLGTVLGQSGVGDMFFHLFKIPYVAMFLLVLLYHTKYGIKLNLISILFLFFGIVASINGGLRNNIDKNYLAHMYGAIIPIIGTSFGYSFLNKSDNKTVLLFHKTFKISFIALSILIVIYFSLFLVGKIIYFGMATRMAYFAGYFLAYKSNLFFIISIILISLTGKRAMLLGTGVQFLSVYVNLGAFKRKKALLKYLLLFFICAIFIFFILPKSYLNRLTPLFNIDFSDKDALYLATSGRSLEIYSIMDHFSDPDFPLLLGGGFGEAFSYAVGSGQDEYIYEAHYIHFSPLSYVLVYGIPFTLILYFLLIFTYIRLLKYSSNIFYLISISSFAMSFVAATMFVDIQFWFFLGTLLALRNNTKLFDKFHLVQTRKV